MTIDTTTEPRTDTQAPDATGTERRLSSDREALLRIYDFSLKDGDSALPDIRELARVALSLPSVPTHPAEAEDSQHE